MSVIQQVYLADSGCSIYIKGIKPDKDNECSGEITINGSHLIILGNSYYFDDLSENDKLLISIKIRILPEGTTIML